MDKEQEEVIDIFSEERSRRDAEEAGLRNRLKVRDFFFFYSSPFLIFIFSILLADILILSCISFLSQKDFFAVGRFEYHPGVS